MTIKNNYSLTSNYIILQHYNLLFNSSWFLIKINY